MVTVTYLSTYLEPLRGLLLLFSRELSDMAGISCIWNELDYMAHHVSRGAWHLGHWKEVHDLYIQLRLNGDSHQKALPV